jgi:putative transposase
VQDVLADRVKAVFGPFEAVDPNQLWVVDALNGPRVGDRKTYLFGFLNDHSRLVVGHRFGFAEDTVRLGAAAHSVRQRRTDPTSK